MTRPSLPIDARLPEIVERVRQNRSLVIVAEPGAGKTTRVPPALLESGLGGKGDIVVLEPRRLATRLAARRVAEEMGESVGRRVGYHVRFESVASEHTRIRFVTEGVLSRRLSSDPTLSGVSIVVLDEFHERHLHSDVALALVHQLQKSRSELGLIVMSATIDADPVAAFLGCEAMHIEGRRFDVVVEHLPQPSDRPLEREVVAATRSLLARGLDGDVLVFLPGAAEIRRCRETCEEVARAQQLELHVLHGDLPAAEQDRALVRSKNRKVILSTNVAETSVTIDGIAAVIDSGLARIAKHSPWSGLPSLVTDKISQASAIQRTGRAGRTRSGVCLRLYTKHDFDTRRKHDSPEIHRVDLAELVLHQRGVGRDPRTIKFLEPPPEAALDAAEELLRQLDAIDRSNAITETGRSLLALPAHPRVGRLLIEAQRRGATELGCLVAAILGEREIRLSARTDMRRGPQGTDTVGASDVLESAEAFEQAEIQGLTPQTLRSHQLDVGAAMAVARTKEQLSRELPRADDRERAMDEEEAVLIATLAAFPDRVARRRSKGSADLVFAAGGGGRLAPTSVVKEGDLLVAVRADEQSGGALVRSASSIEPEWLLELFPDGVAERIEHRLDLKTERVDLVRSLHYGALVLDESKSPAEPSPETSRVLAEGAFARGLKDFCDVEALERLQRRVAFVAAQGGDAEPLSDDIVREALTAACEGCTSFAELRAVSILDRISHRFDARRLAALAPETVAIAGRPNVPVHYEPDRPPWIESYLQEFFGMAQGPTVAGGKVPLTLHLLGPNRRAVQVTGDLSGFWERHYPSIRKELMRRYPRHQWPEDPRTASPNRFKPRRG